MSYLWYREGELHMNYTFHVHARILILYSTSISCKVVTETANSNRLKQVFWNSAPDVPHKQFETYDGLQIFNTSGSRFFWFHNLRNPLIFMLSHNMWREYTFTTTPCLTGDGFYARKWSQEDLCVFAFQLWKAS